MKKREIEQYEDVLRLNINSINDIEQNDNIFFKILDDK